MSLGRSAPHVCLGTPVGRHYSDIATGLVRDLSFENRVLVMD